MSNIQVVSLGFNRYQLVVVIVILLVLGWLMQRNMYVSQAKARDWNRKEQVKMVYQVLREGYIDDQGVFPPHNDRWELTGCGDAVCPTVGLGIACTWLSGSQPSNFECGGVEYLSPLPGSLDNPQTAGPDAPRYRRLDEGGVVIETCVELRSDPEAISVEASRTVFDRQSCPSGRILQWPRG